ncbi:MAG: glycine--tRNA ligase [Minisyncoccia bacterium]
MEKEKPKEKQHNDLMNKIVALAKRRGFVFPSSEIYGGLANTWDFGPLGVELKNNIKRYWWKKIVQERDDVVGLDSAIILNPKTWQASGHLSSFSDPLVECKKCHTRFRFDYLKEGKYGPVELTDGYPHCPLCGGELTQEKKFNLMFKTYFGPAEETANITYLRPETAQGIFLNFKNILNTTRKKIPFGIAQIGKAFRNEITPSNFIFRTREFEQMELEYFVYPREDKKWFNYWCKERMNWYLSLGIKKENLRFRKHSKDELAHYAKEAIDIEYQFPFGWSELEGIANRTDYDLKNHQEHSREDLSYLDEITKEKFIPYVIEPSAGVERTMLAILIDACYEDKDRVVLKLNPKIAPFKVAVFPLVSNKKELIQLAEQIYHHLKSKYSADFDSRGNIGKRYYSQDEIGTPYCITVDYQSLTDKTVTIRDRDTTKQIRVKISEIDDFLKKQIEE